MRDLPPIQEWSPWLRAAFILVPVALGVAVITQHRAISAPPVIAAVVVVVSISVGGAFRRFPLAVAAIPTLATVAWLLAYPAHADAAPLMLVALAAEAGASRPVVGLPVVLAAAAVPIAWNIAGRFDSSLLWAAGIAFAYGAGAVGRALMGLVTELRDAQAGLAARAAADERQRIAREVHDVVAHSLAVTMLHMTGARLAVQSGDYDDAVDALGEAERVGRQSLVEIRRTVGLLAPQQDAADATTPPEPTAADIGALVDGCRQAGMVITFDQQGDASSLPPGIGLALYRIAQESLANAAKHAPSCPVTVSFSVSPPGNGRSTRLRVRNTLPARAPGPSTPGVGLRGMRERASLIGATFDAGANGDGWLVEIDVPA